MTPDEQSKVDAVERDRRQRERDLLAILLLLSGYAERRAVSAVRMGTDPIPVIRDVVMGNPELDLPGVAPSIAEAIKDAQAAGYRRAAKLAGHSGRVVQPIAPEAESEQAARSVAQQILDPLLQRVNEAVTTTEGKTLKEQVAAVRGAFDESQVTIEHPGALAAQTTRTIVDAYGRGMFELYQAVPAKIILPPARIPELRKPRIMLRHYSVLDSRVTTICRQRDGLTLWSDNDYWRRNWPSLHWNCFLPGTNVSGVFVGGLKAWYSGEVTELITLRGHRLTVTANHPVLTDRGWIAAAELNEGDALLSDSREIKGKMIVDEQDSPAAIEDVFEAFRAHGSGFHDTTALDLYGDGISINGKINVVGADWELLREGDATREQSVIYRSFIRLDAASALKACSGHLEFLCRSFLSACGGGPCRSALALNGSSVSFQGFPFESLGGRSTPNRDVVFPQDSGNNEAGKIARFLDALHAFASKVSSHDLNRINVNSGIGVTNGDTGIYQKRSNRFDVDAIFAAQRRNRCPGVVICNNLFGRAFKSADVIRIGIAANWDVVVTEKVANCPWGGPDILGEFLARSAGQVLIDKISRIRRFEYSGHVYDLQSKGGWILSQGIVTSNCRSIVMPAPYGAEESDWLPSTPPMVGFGNVFAGMALLGI